MSSLSRGAQSNLAFVFTDSPKIADPAPGARPAPELERFDRISIERAGQVAPATAAAADGSARALGVLAGVLERDGQEQSATETLTRNLANADHLAILNAIWETETAAARNDRYAGLLAAALPPGHGDGTGHRARWLWRTLRAAELAGLDADQVLRAAGHANIARALRHTTPNAHSACS
jgi:hypothetical protein